MTGKSLHTIGFFRGAGGVRLFYQSWRPPKGIKTRPAVLVFLHGIAEHSDRYQYPVEYFVRRGFTLYAMDLRGHGRSEGPRSYADSLDQLLEDLQAFLEVVRKEKRGRIFLVGHSFGGQLVLNYGIRHSHGLKGIITSSPNIRLAVKVPFLKLLLAPVLSRLVPRLALANEIDPAFLSHDPEVVAAYRNDEGVQKKITTRLADIVLGNQMALVDLAARFKVPCLMMHAGGDRICSPEGTREFFGKIPIRDKTLKVYKGLYHELFNEVRRDEVFKDMEAWIAAHL